MAAVEELKAVFPTHANLAPVALRWMLQFAAVRTILPGASNPDQATANLEALNVTDLNFEQLTAVNAIYDKYIKPQVHQLW